jgi:hypothetical protein
MALVGCGGHDVKASAAGNDSSAAGGSTASTSADTTGNSASVDACQLLTKADAAALFGQAASSQEPEMAPLPDQIGVCQWGWVGAEQTQQVSLKIMTSPGDHYTAIDNAQPLHLGDKSQLVIDETTLSMDIDWVQSGKFFDLHYTASPYQAFDRGKADPLKSLAREISGRL